MSELKNGDKITMVATVIDQESVPGYLSARTKMGSVIHIPYGEIEQPDARVAPTHAEVDKLAVQYATIARAAASDVDAYTNAVLAKFCAPAVDWTDGDIMELARRHSSSRLPGSPMLGAQIINFARDLLVGKKP